MTDIIWIIVATIAAILPVIMIKKYLVNKELRYIALAMIFYAILLISYIHILETAEVSKIYVVLQILQILIVVAYGIFFIGETLYTEKIIGILFGIVAVYLLSKK